MHSHMIGRLRALSVGVSLTALLCILGVTSAMAQADPAPIPRPVLDSDPDTPDAAAAVEESASEPDTPPEDLDGSENTDAEDPAQEAQSEIAQAATTDDEVGGEAETDGKPASEASNDEPTGAAGEDPAQEAEQEIAEDAPSEETGTSDEDALSDDDEESPAEESQQELDAGADQGATTETDDDQAPETENRPEDDAAEGAAAAAPAEAAAPEPEDEEAGPYVPPAFTDVVSQYPILRTPEEMPDAVRETWTALRDAARSGNIEALRPIMNDQDAPPTLSFGEIDDPILYLRSLSGDAEGREILAILLEVLEMGYRHIDVGTEQEMYVWPYYMRYPLDRLTPEQTVEMFTLLTAGDYADMRAYGAYIFFRVGIDKAGNWTFFVAGD